ncbi:hypothetical protein GCM10022384_06580 [Streptomyces marokkonensis]|uniref:Uncharacterized protein n=1 Tax=Streptomyces marokkonensis TaxID=324855 RepID=A0ABP7NYE2_9ACTN
MPWPVILRSASIRVTVARRYGSRSRAHGLQRGAAGVHRDVHAGHHLAVPVPHRRGDGSEAVLQFLVDERVALAPHPAQFRAQGVRRGEGAGGVRAQVGTGEPGLGLGVRQSREDHPAHGGEVRREAGADRDRRRHDAAGRHTGDVHDVVAVQDAQ